MSAFSLPLIFSSPDITPEILAEASSIPALAIRCEQAVLQMYLERPNLTKRTTWTLDAKALR